MSFFAENRSRPRVSVDVMGQEPPLKRLRSLLGVDLSVGEVGHGVGTALGLSADPLSLAAYGRPFPDASFLGSADAWNVRPGLDENPLGASAMPVSLGSLPSLGMPPSSAAAFIERNLPKLETRQVMPAMDLGNAPVAGLTGIQAPLSLPTHARSKDRLCKHFVEGKCKFKGICNFAHSLEELKSMPGEGDLEGKALVKKYRAKAEVEKHTAGSRQDPPSAVEMKMKLCKHFIEGECKFKDGCHFAHSIEELKKLPDEADIAGIVLLERYKSKVDADAAAGAEGVQGRDSLVCSSTSSSQLKAKLCKHFIIGNCKFKENCIFAHSVGELKSLPGEGDEAGKVLLELYQTKAKLEKHLQAQPPVQAIEAAMPGALAKTNLDNVSVDAQPLQKLAMDFAGNSSAHAKVDDKSARLMKTKMCRHFLIGACKYMHTCTFAHCIEELKPPPDFIPKRTPPVSSASPSKAPSTAIAGADLVAALTDQSAQQSDGKQIGVYATGAQSKDDKQGSLKTKACRYFLDGTCRFGVACAFVHGNGGTSQSSVQLCAGEMKATYKTRLCNMWEKDKTCTFGSKCHFAHGQEELRPRAGPTDPSSNSRQYGAMEMEVLSRARQLGLPMSLPYSYEVTNTTWRPFQVGDEAMKVVGGGLSGASGEKSGMDMEASQAYLRSLLQNYGQLGQASSLSSLGGANPGLLSNMYVNLPAWQTR